MVCGIALVNSGGGNTVQGNYIGLNAAGTAASTRAGGSSCGIAVRGFNGFNEIGDTIGGTSPADRNVIAGTNLFGQILFEPTTTGSQSSGHIVQGNLIGTDKAGTAAISSCISSVESGISLNFGTANVTIGGGSPVVVGGATFFTGGNLISGNCAHGLHLGGPDSTITGNQIVGNLIGTDVTGTLALGNQGAAIVLFGVGSTTIQDNVISASINTASNGEGIDVDGGGPTTIQSNKIGTDVTGALNLGNQGSGILIEGNSSGNLMDSNVIAFNGCCQLGGEPASSLPMARATP